MYCVHAYTYSWGIRNTVFRLTSCAETIDVRLQNSSIRTLRYTKTCQENAVSAFQSSFSEEL